MHIFIRNRFAKCREVDTFVTDGKGYYFKAYVGRTIAFPKYKESMIVSVVDDYAATQEYLGHVQKITFIFKQNATSRSIGGVGFEWRKSNVRSIRNYK